MKRQRPVVGKRSRELPADGIAPRPPSGFAENPPGPTVVDSAVAAGGQTALAASDARFSSRSSNSNSWNFAAAWLRCANRIWMVAEVFGGTYSRMPVGHRSQITSSSGVELYSSVCCGDL